MRHRKPRKIVVENIVFYWRIHHEDYYGNYITIWHNKNQIFSRFVKRKSCPPGIVARLIRRFIIPSLHLISNRKTIALSRYTFYKTATMR